MKKLLFTLLFVPYMLTAQLQPINNLNEELPKWSSDQITTFVGTTLASGAVSTKVEEWTRSPFLGTLSGLVVGVGIGYAKDRYDQSWNTSIPNENPFLNDTLAGGIGGIVGSYTLTIDLESLFEKRGLRGNVFKVGNKYNRYNARRFKKGRRFLGIFKRKTR